MTERDNGGMTEAELIRRLGELPTRVEPQNDPWPQIESRIAKDAGRSTTASSWLRLAAAVVLAFAVGIFLGQSWQFSPPGSPNNGELAQETGSFGMTPNLEGALLGAEREYQAAFSEFANIGESATVLKPATLDSIERDWQEMLDAESALTTALEQYPNNPWLNKRMLELRERQLAMLKQLAGLDRTSRRTEI
jgi:hypothetical protein